MQARKFERVTLRTWRRRQAAKGVGAGRLSRRRWGGDDNWRVRWSHGRRCPGRRICNASTGRNLEWGSPSRASALFEPWLGAAAHGCWKSKNTGTACPLHCTALHSGCYLKLPSSFQAAPKLPSGSQQTWRRVAFPAVGVPVAVAGRRAGWGLPRRAHWRTGGGRLPRGACRRPRGAVRRRADRWRPGW